MKLEISEAEDLVQLLERYLDLSFRTRKVAPDFKNRIYARELLLRMQGRGRGIRDRKEHLT